MVDGVEREHPWDLIPTTKLFLSYLLKHDRSWLRLKSYNKRSYDIIQREPFKAFPYNSTLRYKPFRFIYMKRFSFYQSNVVYSLFEIETFRTTNLRHLLHKKKKPQSQFLHVCSYTLMGQLQTIRQMMLIHFCSICMISQYSYSFRMWFNIDNWIILFTNFLINRKS